MNKEREAQIEGNETKQKINKVRKKYTTILMVTLIVMCILAMFGYRLMKRYDESILNVYASQQDNYVQLVLDQINLQPDRTEESIITDIIQTLDSGNSHFWTLSRDEVLLFVKNVTETGKYQGVEADNFYVTESGEAFFEELRLNHVTHEIVVMEGKRYVASGVLFEYNGGTYRICLLTDETVILDNNDFLSVKIEMYLFVIVILIILLIVTMVAEIVVQKKEITTYRRLDRIEVLNRHVKLLEEKLRREEDFSSRHNVYSTDMMDMFLQQLDSRKIRNVVFAELQFEDKEQKTQFLILAETLLDEAVLRFQKGENGLSVLFVEYDVAQAKRALLRTGLKEENIVYLDTEKEEENLLDFHKRKTQEV